LVPYGLAPNNFGAAKEMSWRAGANENTSITISHDVLVQGEQLKAGPMGYILFPKKIKIGH